MSHQIEEAEEHEFSSHPGPREYIGVAVILAVVTAVEVGIYYVDAMRPVLVPFLLALALVKFTLVALWFMHLRFDSPIFQRFFLTGIAIALSVFGVILWYFFTHGGPAPVAT